MKRANVDRKRLAGGWWQAEADGPLIRWTASGVSETQRQGHDM